MGQDDSRNSGKNPDTGQKKTKKKKERTSGQKIRHGIWLSIKILLLILVVLGIAAAIYLYSRYGKRLLAMQGDAVQMVKDSTEEDFKKTQTSLVYDTDGNLISTLKGAKEVYYLDYADIPQMAVESMVAVEDRKFWKHSGIDLSAITRAGLALIKNKGEITQGASTITQQLARNIFLTHQETWERKIREMFLAIELTKKYSKEQVMEFYLNNIYFANGLYGIQAASLGYFDKGVKDISLSQMAFICAIPNNPSLYDPVVNKKKTLARRDRILDQLLAAGKIDEEDCRLAKKEKIRLNMQKTDKKDYVETFAYYSAIRALMEADGFVFKNSFESTEEKEAYDTDYSQRYNECQQTLYTSGYRIYTSLDMEKQEKLQEAVDSALSGFDEVNEEGIFALQGAAVSVDNDNGRVVAIVGGRSQETTGYTLNRAYQSYRQPGSAIKPLVVYTPIFERGYNPEDYVMDEKTEDGPKNNDDVYSGRITIRKAVEVSKNTVAWQFFGDLTPRTGIQYLLDMSFNRIGEKDFVPAAAIGGFNTGVSPLEMTSGFAAIENGGVYRTPTCIVKIMDPDGNELVSAAGISKTVYEEEACRKMTSCLESALESSSGRRTRVEGIPTAGKTGTTNDRKDGWFVGYTRYYTTGVWVGYDMPRYMSGLSGSTYPSQIWHEYMAPVHEGMAALPFEDYTHPVVEEVEKPEKEPEDRPALLPGDNDAEEKEEEEEEEVVPPVEEPAEDEGEMGEDWDDEAWEDFWENTGDDGTGEDDITDPDEPADDDREDSQEDTPPVDPEDPLDDGIIDPEDSWYYEEDQNQQ